MNPIRVLDQVFANQIAAGEVVERPVSVVKELVENALDSGATAIDVVVDGSGASLIQVRDNGSGITAEDLPLAVLRHATSKITRISDLDTLRSLGFRGEALPSIGSVSRLEIVTRPAASDAGMRLMVEGGNSIELVETGCPAGTTVTVRDLFYNTPARLKFLRSANTEFGLISDVVGRLALAHPHVRFTLAHPKHIVLQTSGRGLSDAIGSVLGSEIARSLFSISINRDAWSIEGFISPPNLARSSRQGQTFIVNGRVIRSPLLSRALEEGYHTLIPNKTFPLAVLHFHVPPDEYDVNVHPTKMEIRFRQEKELSRFIADGVRQALLKNNPIPAFDFPSSPKRSGLEQVETVAQLINRPGTKSPSTYQPEPDNGLPSALNTSGMVKEGGRGNYTLSQSTLPFPPQQGPGKVSDFPPEQAVPRVEMATLPYRDFPAESEHLSDPADGGTSISLTEPPIPSGTGTVPGQGTPFFYEGPVEPHFLHTIWPVGQVFNTYILATDGQVLVIIDQHAAHERVNYERVLKEVKAVPPASQELLIPIPMEFTLEEEQFLLEQLWFLSEMGFVLEQFGPRTYLLRSVPTICGNQVPENLLREFLSRVMEDHIPPHYDSLLSEWIYTVACKASIKGGESLSSFEMEQLLFRLGQADNPYTCPHGRPTIIKITRQEMEKRFHRT